MTPALMPLLIVNFLLVCLALESNWMDQIRFVKEPVINCCSSVGLHQLKCDKLVETLTSVSSITDFQLSKL